MPIVRKALLLVQNCNINHHLVQMKNILLNNKKYYLT